MSEESLRVFLSVPKMKAMRTPQIGNVQDSEGSV